MTVASALPQERRIKETKRKNRRSRVPYVLIAPSLALVAVFLIYPVANVVWSSFHQQNVLKPWDDGFVGLDNFRRILSDGLFWDSLIFTGQWVITEDDLQLIIGFLSAHIFT